MYTFETLSPNDFEILTRDLLQKELSLTLESFKSGRDNGIDLRYSQNKENDIIIQCKHYQGSTFNDLIKTMKREVEKIKELSPERYILVTSLPLTPKNKEKIIEICEPYITRNSDIYSQNDINNLLQKFPEVEKNTFKLWMTSTNVLERLFHSGTYNKSEFKLENIKEKIKIFVPNPSLDKANKILEENNFVVISGAPGVGKTTLADMIIWQYVSQGYEFINVTDNINEAVNVYKRDENCKQIFYYDDFLGETNLAKNEDSDLILFIKQINKDKNKKLVLATREYILQQTKLSSEKIDYFEFKKCIIDLKSYSNLIKAEILYNHLYFSKLPEEYIQSIISNGNYVSIINHDNYNPRIIEYMTKPKILEYVKAENYFNEFMNNLNNPENIWSHAFENHLNNKSRSILFALTTTQYISSYFGNTDRIKETAKKICRKLYSENITDLDFKKNLKILNGDFIDIKGKNKLSFSNPSVIDFLENYILNNDLIPDFIELSEQYEHINWLYRTYFQNKSASAQNINIMFAKLKELNNNQFNTRYIDLLLQLIISSNDTTKIPQIKPELDELIKRNYRPVILENILKNISHDIFSESKIIKDFASTVKEKIIDYVKFNDNAEDYLVIWDFIESFKVLWEEENINKIFDDVNLCYEDLVDATIEIHKEEADADGLYFEIEKFQQLIDKYNLPYDTIKIEEAVEELEMKEEECEYSSNLNSVSTINSGLQNTVQESIKIINLFDSLNERYTNS